ncbi:50S ribosomal protein L23 [Candidatus Saccharibacteria bacterium]|nr:50S ribosomal protein L23 [Candidatus Saccharibacteria bacterium]
MSKTMVLRPRLSEKAYGLSQSLNRYVFIVPLSSTKQAVAQAVTDQFGVSVVSVNIGNVKGKAKRSVRKGGRSVTGVRLNIKKAYVTLKSGDSIPIFAAEEAADAKAAKAKAKAKKSSTKLRLKEKA